MYNGVAATSLVSYLVHNSLNISVISNDVQYIITPQWTLLLSTYLEGPSCKMTDDLITNNYEEKGDKYYKMYVDLQDYATAAAKCQSVGARLVMFKNVQDFEIVKEYRGNSLYCIAEHYSIIWELTFKH